MYILNMIEWDLETEDEIPIVHPSVFASKVDASKHACSLIQEWINADWNLAPYANALDASEIQDFIIEGNGNNDDVKYMCAITRFHRVQHTASYATLRREFVVDYRLPMIAIQNPMILPAHTYVGLNGTPSTTKASTKVEAIKPKAFVASKAGATCRLPCGQVYEYAYADKEDGTFECRSCKMMHEVFSR